MSVLLLLIYHTDCTLFLPPSLPLSHTASLYNNLHAAENEKIQLYIKHTHTHVCIHKHVWGGGFFDYMQIWRDEFWESCLKADSWNLSVSTQSSEWPQFCIVPWLHAGHAAFAISDPTTWCADFTDGRAEKVWLHRHVSLEPWSSYTRSHHGNCRKQTCNPRQKADMQPKTKSRQNRLCVQFVC